MDQTDSNEADVKVSAESPKLVFEGGKPDVTLVDESSKNRTKIYCPLCKSLILREGVGILTYKEIFLHHDRKQQNKEEGETVKWFWMLTNMLQFENIGFTKDVTNYKYLTCADCEKPCVGIQYLDTPNQLFLSAKRVRYTLEDTPK